MIWFRFCPGTAHKYLEDLRGFAPVHDRDGLGDGARAAYVIGGMECVLDRLWVGEGGDDDDDK